MANWDSSEVMSDVASESGSMRVGKAVASFRSEGSRAYLIASPAPSSDPDIEPCRRDTSPAVFEIHWLEACSDPEEDRKAMTLSEIHF
jgi:hypothetical protein